jgi:hypothetical protein
MKLGGTVSRMIASELTTFVALLSTIGIISSD